MTLSGYDYTIRYKPGPQNANADLFGRLPLPEEKLVSQALQRKFLFIDLFTFL